jgi:hypothetical protein
LRSRDALWEAGPVPRRRLAGVAAAALTTALLAAPLAGGAPTPSDPPSIAGKPRYNSLLTCNPGTWSADAQSYSYSWQYSSGSEFATTRTYRPEAFLVGDEIVCQVTARDASGDSASATSPPVRVGLGRITMKLHAKKVQHRKVTLRGRVGPAAALRKGGGGRTPTLVAYREEPDALHQLFGKQTLKKNGRFRIVAPDEPGRNTYLVNFHAAEPSLWESAEGRVDVRLKKR